MQNNEYISAKIKTLRIKSRKKGVNKDLNKPVSFWIKSDRLIHEIGKEFTIILRTKGCRWALGETGGCSMCGYIKDSYTEDVDSQYIINQFDYAFNSKINEIEEDEENYIIKIFNSGSFFDDNDVPMSVRKHIYEKISTISKIKEVVVESRVEFINKDKLLEMREELGKKYCEIGIGLETTKDYNIGIKAYLLFKPPFLNEQAAIDDCSNSIKILVEKGITSISINPVNIQSGSLTEKLWYQKHYRPPWFYSLFKCLKHSLIQENLKTIRILCDPSGAGTKRGIHNCLERECNEQMKSMLQRFVLNQNLNELKMNSNECECKSQYHLQKDYS